MDYDAWKTESPEDERLRLRFGSVCSGIEGASVAWTPLGWKCQWVAEIEPFPSAVIQERWGHKNYGDFTRIPDDAEPIDVLVGGTPCQSFSVAGLRGGLADDRGNLALEFLRLAGRTRPRWVVWENVPGVLSSDGGRDFGSILGGLAELGYGWAYRILDAQYFGVPQRRRRVFVVGCLGDWRAAAAVLFERHCLQGHPAPSRKAGQGITGCFTAGAHPGSYNGQDAGNDMLIAATVGQRMRGQDDSCADNLQVVHSLRADGFDASEDGTGRGTPLTVSYGVQANIIGREVHNGGNGLGFSEEIAPTLTKMDQHGVVQTLTSNGDGHTGFRDEHGLVTAFAQNTRDEVREMAVVGALAAEPGMKQQSYIRSAMAVRRLTPAECEALQGFPRGYTAITFRGKPAADGPRYKALGNSWAVPVVRWIGQRIQAVAAPKQVSLISE